MTTQPTPPNASAEYDTTYGNPDPAIDEGMHSSKYLGHDRILESVNDRIPRYDEVLGLGMMRSSAERHERLGGLAFGKINKDIGSLRALQAAVASLSETIRLGKEEMGTEAWEGQSYENFCAEVGKVETTLNDYSAALGVVASGLETAMSGIDSYYAKYQDDNLNINLNWDRDEGDVPEYMGHAGQQRLSPPGEWWRMSKKDGSYLLNHCISHDDAADGYDDCPYDKPEFVKIIDGKVMNKYIRDTYLEKWDCMYEETDDMDAARGVVRSQYETTVRWAEEEKNYIHKKINAYCKTADETHSYVGETYDSALVNLTSLAESKTLSHLTLPGAEAAGGPGGQSGDPASGGDSSGGGDGSSGGGGGSPGGGGSYPSSSGDPAAAAGTEMPGATDPNALAPEESATDPTLQQPETVEIKDGDRTITVSSPDGEGKVKVTIDDGTGEPKTYELDFSAADGATPTEQAGDAASAFRPTGQDPAAASGDPASGAAAGQPGAEDAQQVAAGADGKAVVQDGTMTLTAEQGEPGVIMMAVDSGDGQPPTNYTVDYSDPENPTAGGGASAASMPASSAAGSDQNRAGAHSFGGDLNEPGEAALASAPEDGGSQAPAGGGMPMLGGMGAGGGGGDDLARNSGGWSTRGDLFDTGEPVFSAHGVVGEEDRDSHERGR